MPISPHVFQQPLTYYKSIRRRCDLFTLHSEVIMTSNTIQYLIAQLLLLFLHRSNSTAPSKCLCCCHVVPTQLLCKLESLCGYSKVIVEMLPYSGVTLKKQHCYCIGTGAVDPLALVLNWRPK